MDQITPAPYVACSISLPETEVFRRFKAAISLPRSTPRPLLSNDKDWRKMCLQKVGHIPAGYTYLAQLMGHDMGKTMPADLPGDAPQNLIAQPLTLETLYGKGPNDKSPNNNPQLYDAKTLCFNLPATARLAHLAPDPSNPTGPATRPLFDNRNRDTLMLHELAVAMMQFHNRCATGLLRQGATAQTAYDRSRARVVGVWHQIIRTDILPRFVRPDTLAGPVIALCSLNEITLLAGLFRAFHALPLQSYHLGHSGPHGLGDLMSTPHEDSFAERNWRIDWQIFLSDKGPKTGISASVARPLKGLVGQDLTTARTVHPARFCDPPIAAALASLPGAWPAKLTPDALAAAFNQIAPPPINPVRPAEILYGPLYQMLMIEAQLYGHLGGFGPFGSALFFASIQGALSRAAPCASAPEPHDPKTMQDLITQARSPLP